MSRANRASGAASPSGRVGRAAVALGLMAISAGGAVEIEMGRVYGGGTRLEATDLGVAFTVPEGWRGSWPVGSEVFVLRAESDPDSTIIGLGQEATRDELAAKMAAPIDLGGGAYLVPSGPVGERGGVLTGRYEVRGAGAGLAAYAEGLAGPGGIAVGYILIGAAGSIAGHESAVRALVDSTTLGSPAVAGAPGGEAPAAGSGAGDRWDRYLAGKYLVRYFTRTGYTDEQHLWLCSDGTFHRRGAGGGFGGGASGAFQSDASGRWTASGAGESGTLILRYRDGSTATHQLRWDYQENHLYLDGKRWMHDTNEVCR